MSVTAASGIFQSAAATLATPSAALSGFNPAAASAPPAGTGKAGAHHGHHLHEQTQSALLQLQQATSAGALATGLDSVLGGNT